MKSFVTELTFKREFAPEKFIYTMCLKDGVKGDFWTASKDNLPAIGEEIEYSLHPNKDPQYQPTIKLVKPAGAFKAFPKNQSAENARVALASATQLIVAGKHKEGKTVLELAEAEFEWLEKKSQK